MKVYSHDKKRSYDYKVHFGVGNSVKTACGVVLGSRRVMVNLFGNSDGVLITDDIKRVTCKRCLAIREQRLRKLVAIERALPGIFDHDTLCGEQWLFDHAFNVSAQDIEAQTLEVDTGQMSFTLDNRIVSKDRKKLLRALIKKGGE